MREFSFTVPVNPVACARPRFSKTGSVYMPTKTKTFQKHVAAAAAAAKLPCIGTPITIHIAACFELPKSRHRKKYPLLVASPMTQKPDVDNVAKNVLDGLREYFDDCQVYSLTINKWWEPQGSKGRVEIRIVTNHEWIAPDA